MKRNELVVGMMVAVGRLNGASSNISRARVVATDANRPYRFGRNQLLGGVRVVHLAFDDSVLRDEVVALSQIAGPWEQTDKQVKEWRAAETKRQVEKEAGRTDARAKAESAVAALKALGFAAQMEYLGGYEYGTYKVTMVPTIAEALAATLQLHRDVNATPPV